MMKTSLEDEVDPSRLYSHAVDHFEHINFERTDFVGMGVGI